MFATKESHFGKVLLWLKREGAEGIDDLQFRTTNHGLACFTTKALAKNDIIFTIPRHCILSVENCMRSFLSQRVIEYAAKLGGDAMSLVSCEFLLWLNMCAYRSPKKPILVGDGMPHYIRSLSDVAPDVRSWPGELGLLFMGTALAAGPQAASADRLQAQWKLFCAACPEHSKKIMLGDLMWARGQYLSRRYPNHYAATTTDSPGSSSEPCVAIDIISGEVGMQNLGSLVPLLDVLNHNGDEQWLNFDVTDTHLVVRAGVPRNKGEELYSNYGSDRSNEALLFAYGFAIENNIHDEVSLTLRVGDGAATSFTLRDGGLAAVSAEIWKVLDGLHEEENGNDVCVLSNGVTVHPASLQALESFLTAKLRTLTNVDQASEKWVHIKKNNKKRKRFDILEDNLRCVQYANYYRAGQRRIIEQVLRDIGEELDKFIESDEDNNYSERI